jgi:hypothetical protein
LKVTKKAAQSAKKSNRRDVLGLQAYAPVKNTGKAGYDCGAIRQQAFFLGSPVYAELFPRPSLPELIRHTLQINY